MFKLFSRFKKTNKNAVKTATPVENGTAETVEDDTSTAEDNAAMETNDKPVRRRREKPWKNILFYFALTLSVGSLAWTGYGIYDLLDQHTAGLAVALVADLIWAGVLVAEVQGARIRGKEWPVTAIGWVAVTAVVVLLVIHGAVLGNVGWIVAAPLVPYGAKIMWMFTLTAPYDPTAPTQRQQAEIDLMIQETGVEVQKLEAQREKDRAEIRAMQAENDKVIERIRAAAQRSREMQIAQMEAGMGFPRMIPGEIVREDSGEDHQLIAGFTGSSSAPTDPSRLPAGSSSGPHSFPVGFQASPAADTNQRIEEVRMIIDMRGGDPKSIPLEEIERLYKVSNSTASRIRAKATEGYA